MLTKALALDLVTLLIPLKLCTKMVLRKPPSRSHYVSQSHACTTDYRPISPSISECNVIVMINVLTDITSRYMQLL